MCDLCFVPEVVSLRSLRRGFTPKQEVDASFKRLFRDKVGYMRGFSEANIGGNARARPVNCSAAGTSGGLLEAFWPISESGRPNKHQDSIGSYSFVQILGSPRHHAGMRPKEEMGNRRTALVFAPSDGLVG